MARKRKSVQQHSKGKARPRRWHHGRAQGRKDDAKLKAADARIGAAERRAQAHEPQRQQLLVDMADHRDVVAQLARVAPFVPTW